MCSRMWSSETWAGWQVTWRRSSRRTHKCVHRVGGGCTACRQPRGEQDNNEEEKRYETRHNGVVPIGSVKAGKQKPRREGRKSKPAQAAGNGDYGAARKHQVSD